MKMSFGVSDPTVPVPASGVTSDDWPLDGAPLDGTDSTLPAQGAVPVIGSNAVPCRQSNIMGQSANNGEARPRVGSMLGSCPDREQAPGGVSHLVPLSAGRGPFFWRPMNCPHDQAKAVLDGYTERQLAALQHRCKVLLEARQMAYFRQPSEKAAALIHNAHVIENSLSIVRKHMCGSCKPKVLAPLQVLLDAAESGHQAVLIIQDGKWEVVSVGSR